MLGLSPATGVGSRQIANEPQGRAATSGPGLPDLATANRIFYDRLWNRSRLVAPERFNTWPIVQPLLADGGDRLEVAPGLRPRLPIAGTYFADISTHALAKLRLGGGLVTLAAATAIPFPDARFRLLCALDIIEHLDDDDAGFAELSRLAVPGGTLLLSVPLHPSRWSVFDDIVGHRRRYEPDLLAGKLRQHGFSIEGSAPFGMRPRSSRLATYGMNLLARHPAQGFWCYNNLLMPLAIRQQRPLRLTNGLIAADAVDDLLL
ncbi:MAG TPA: methyltransferase domain-containing protein, partial [Rhodopila sp.]